MTENKKGSIMKEFDEGVKRDFLASLDNNTMKLLKEYTVEKDEIKKLEMKAEIAEKVVPVYLDIVFSKLTELSEKEWEQFKEEAFKPLGEQLEKISEKVFRYEFFGKDPLLAAAQIMTFERYSDLDFKIKMGEKLKSRLLELLGTVYGALLLYLAAQKPLLDVIEVAKKYLKVDDIWIAGMLALSIEESLVKKKLIELGIKQDSIEGKDFFSIHKMLVKEIRKKEKREPEAEIQLVTGYRNIRNNFQHMGYLYKPKENEIFNMLAHVNNLSHSLWPEDGGKQKSYKENIDEMDFEEIKQECEKAVEMVMMINDHDDYKNNKYVYDFLIQALTKPKNDKEMAELFDIVCKIAIEKDLTHWEQGILDILSNYTTKVEIKKLIIEKGYLDDFVLALSNSRTYDTAGSLSRIIRSLNSALNENQIKRIVKAFISNDQIHGSFICRKNLLFVFQKHKKEIRNEDVAKIESEFDIII